MRERTSTISIRFTPEEIRAIGKIVKESGGNRSDFIRFCVNTQMAQGGNREHEKLLADMIARGMKETISKMVQAEKKKQAG